MNKMLRTGILCGLFIVPFIVFFVSSSILFPFISGKNFLFRIIVEIIFALWAILALRDKDYLPKRSWVLYAYTAFFVLLGVADMFGENGYRSFWSNFERMEGFVAHIHFFLYFVVLSSTMHTEKLWRWFLGTWIGVSVIMCLYGLNQLSGGAVINQGGVRLDGTFGNATYLAVFLLFMFFFTGLFAVRAIAHKRSSLWFIVPIMILELAILYYTATRGAILGLIGGLFITAVLIAWKGRHEHKVVRNLAVGMLVGLFVLIGGFLAVRKADFVTQSPVLSRFSSLSFSDIKTQGRYYIWPMALEGIKERPILGWGQENFSIIFSKNYNPKMYAQEQWFDRAHNMFIDWFVAGGILVLIPYLGLFFFFFWYVWKKDNLSLSVAEKSLLTGLMAGYMFQGIFVFDNLVSYILFFSVLAYVHSISKTKHFALPSWLREPITQNVITSFVVVAALFTLYSWNIQPIRGGQTLIKAMTKMQQGDFKSSLTDFKKVSQLHTFASGEAREQLSTAAQTFLGNNVPQEIRLEYISFTQNELKEQISSNPNDARSYVFQGNFLRSLGSYDESLVAFKKAIDLSPSKQTILFELGATYIAKKDYKSALETFKRSYELDKSFREAQILYGVGAVYVNDNVLANEVFSTIDQEVLLFDNRIVAALADTGRYADLVDVFERRLQTERGKKDPQNTISLAISYVQIGQNMKAIQLLNQLVVENPGYKEQVEAYIKQISQ